MRIIIVFIITCSLAAAIPLLPMRHDANSTNMYPLAFPDHYQGRKLQPIAMTEHEKRFYRRFPGKLSKYTDGQRNITFKWIDRPTRKLHPASDCYRGMGFSIYPEALQVDHSGHKWGAFRAVKGNNHILVKEKISDPSNHHWTDVSSWYWSALLGRSKGPWLVVTIAERSRQKNL